jgi:hypothetical protein
VSQETLYRLAADAVLVVHALFVAFVVLGLLAVYLGSWLRWGWVRNLWFRLTHLAAIGVVVLQAWVGVLCPLTVWEARLREFAGGESYDGSFIEHWLQTLLYYEAPARVFVTLYTVFAGVVVLSWFTVPPQRRP